MTKPFRDQRPPRRPRNYQARGGYKLTVMKGGPENKWQVLYVAEVDQNHLVWTAALPGYSTSPAWVNEVKPFDTWDAAMAHAATLRTWYGDQSRRDNLIWNRLHGIPGSA